MRKMVVLAVLAALMDGGAFFGLTHPAHAGRPRQMRTIIFIAALAAVIAAGGILIGDLLPHPIVVAG